MAGRRADGGFTILELLTVVAIITMMTALLIVGTIRVRTRSKKTATFANIALLERAIDSYAMDWREYPCEATTGVYAGAADAFYENAANVLGINTALVEQLVTKQKEGPYLPDSKYLIDTDADGTPDIFVDAFSSSTSDGAPLCYKRPGNPNPAVTVQNNPAPDIFSAGPDGDYSTPDDNLKNYE